MKNSMPASFIKINPNTIITKESSTNLCCITGYRPTYYVFY